MHIAIGSDHAGWEIKEKIKVFLNQQGYVILDYGTSSSESCDYPDFAIAVARSVVAQQANLGILICGTGIGMAITANKIPGIRAAACVTETMAKFSKEHNNCNILCLGARLNTEEEMKNIISAWLKSQFEGGRHERRLNKIDALERECQNLSPLPRPT